MTKLIYGINDRPKTLIETLGVSLQHILCMVSSSIVVPLLLAPIMGMNVKETGLLISLVLITSGISTLIQIFFGSRLPIIQGLSFAFLGSFLSIIYYVQSLDTGSSPSLMMQYIMGAVILGGLVEMLVGYTGLAGKIKKYFTPIVIGPVIFLIGASLFEIAAPKAGIYWPIAILAIILIIYFAHILGNKKPVFRVYSLLLGIGIAYLLCLILTLLNIIPPDHPCYVNFTHINEAPILQNPANFVFPWGLPKFSIAFFVATLIAYIISMIESIGDYYSCCYFCNVDEPDKKMISNGLGAEGLGCTISGLFGSFPNTSYSENIAIIGLTKIASRYIAIVTGILLICLGLFSKIGVLIATIPEPIIGALYCILFAMISGIGLTQLKKADISKDRNIFIFGFAIFMGFSLTAYFKGVHADASILDPKNFTGWNYIPMPVVWPGYQSIADIVNSIGKNSMAIAAITAIVLDNLLPDKD
ncbi:MAG: uracil-xanthine permease family protein [Vampirovibrionia bacterium]